MYLYVNGDNGRTSHDVRMFWYFDSFKVEHIPKEIKNFIGNKDMAGNILRTQAYDLIMSWYFCIGFIDFMLKGKSVLHYTKLLPSNEWQNNTNIFSVDSKRLR